jgi:hypothetical protein
MAGMAVGERLAAGCLVWPETWRWEGLLVVSLGVAIWLLLALEDDRRRPRYLGVGCLFFQTADWDPRTARQGCVAAEEGGTKKKKQVLLGAVSATA